MVARRKRKNVYKIDSDDESGEDNDALVPKDDEQDMSEPINDGRNSKLFVYIGV
jgi:hypothetical protein